MAKGGRTDKTANMPAFAETEYSSRLGSVRTLRQQDILQCMVSI